MTDRNHDSCQWADQYSDDCVDPSYDYDHDDDDDDDADSGADGGRVCCRMTAMVLNDRNKITILGTMWVCDDANQPSQWKLGQ